MRVSSPANVLRRTKQTRRAFVAVRRFGENEQTNEKKQREERKRNPMYIDQDHFDSEWYDYSDEIEDLGDMSVEHDEYPDSRKIF